MKTFLSFYKNKASVCFLFIAASFIYSLSGNPCAAQVCSSPASVIYTLSNTGDILPITVSTAVVGTPLNPDYPVASTHANAIGYNPVNGKFYFFQNNASGVGAQIFMSFDPLSRVYTVLADAPIMGRVNRGCVSYNGTGYYCIDTKSGLYYYNITNNTWTLITDTFTDQFANDVTSIFIAQSSGDMAIDGLGNLWIISSSNPQWAFYELNGPLPTTSKTSIKLNQLIAPKPTPGGDNFAGIAFSPSGQIYMSTNDDLYIMQTNFTVSHIAVFSIAGSGNDLTSCNFPFKVLPVTWINFSAALQSDGNQVTLSWEVSAELNVKGYFAEHSADGLHWDEIGFIPGSRMEKSSVTYKFSDNYPASGNNYYRIREVDFDDNTKYSATRMVVFSGKSRQLSLWPNPAKDMVNVHYNGVSSNAKAMIFDQLDRMISSTLIHPGDNNVNISNLPAGSYIIHLQSADGTSCNAKMIKN